MRHHKCHTFGWQGLQKGGIEMIAMLVAYIQIPPFVCVLQFLADERRQAVVARKLKPSRIKGALRRQPGVCNQDGLFSLNEKSGVSEVRDLHFPLVYNR